MNAGPARIPQHHTTLDYCRELGVPIEVFANQNADGWFFNESGDGVVGPLADKRIRHRTAKADYFGYVSELLAKAISQGALDADLRPEDAERMVEFLRGFGALGPGMRYEGGPNRGYIVPPGAGLEAGTVDGPPPSVSDLLASQLGFYFPFEQTWDQAMLMFQPVGGMDRIPYALAEAIDGPIRYGVRRSRSITVRDAEVEVVASDGNGARAILADYCICTIPPPVLATIPTNLPPAIQADIAALRPLSVAKMGLEFKRRFWEEDEGIFGGITDTNMDLRHDLVSLVWLPRRTRRAHRLLQLLRRRRSLWGHGAEGPRAPGARAGPQDPRRRLRQRVPRVVLAALGARTLQPRRLGRVAGPHEPGR